MENSIPYIVILSEQSVRAKSLSDLIHAAIGTSNNVFTLKPGELKTFQFNGSKPIFLLDLMGCNQPSQQIIKALKNDQNDAKIIALHMYRDRSLIAPIMNEGVDGYLYYEPTRAELAEALKNVQNGKKYEPTYIDA
jgi:DNA-binding NarL/FixJ family response regulator